MSWIVALLDEPLLNLEEIGIRILGQQLSDSLLDRGCARIPNSGKVPRYSFSAIAWRTVSTFGGIEKS